MKIPKTYNKGETMLENKFFLKCFIAVFVIALTFCSIQATIIYSKEHPASAYQDETKFSDETWAKQKQRAIERQAELDRLEQERKQAEEQAAAKARAEAVKPVNATGGLTKSGGVYYYVDSRGVTMKETWYSSKKLYHYLTPQWHTDAEGFWHDAEGYYVVSCNEGDHAYNEVFMTSKGLAKRWDTGCDLHVVDFYVNWDC